MPLEQALFSVIRSSQARPPPAKESKPEINTYEGELQPPLPRSLPGLDPINRAAMRTAAREELYKLNPDSSSIANFESWAKGNVAFAVDIAHEVIAYLGRTDCHDRLAIWYAMDTLVVRHKAAFVPCFAPCLPKLLHRCMHPSADTAAAYAQLLSVWNKKSVWPPDVEAEIQALVVPKSIACSLLTLRMESENFRKDLQRFVAQASHNLTYMKQVSEVDLGPTAVIFVVRASWATNSESYKSTAQCVRCARGRSIHLKRWT